MTMLAPNRYAGHRFPPAIISHAIWLYFRFALSYRDVEDMLAERGIDVSYETVRRWALKFGATIARKLRRGRSGPDVRWHLDEVFVSINGRQLYVWRAVDSEGEVLDILVQPRRDRKAALKLMRKLLKKQGVAPATIVTDKLGSYRSALREAPDATALRATLLALLIITFWRAWCCWPRREMFRPGTPVTNRAATKSFLS